MILLPHIAARLNFYGLDPLGVGDVESLLTCDTPAELVKTLRGIYGQDGAAILYAIAEQYVADGFLDTDAQARRLPRPADDRGHFLHSYPFKARALLEEAEKALEKEVGR